MQAHLEIPTCGEGDACRLGDAAMITRLAGLRTVTACEPWSARCGRYGDGRRAVRSQASRIISAARADDSSLVVIPSGDGAADVAGSLLDVDLAVLLVPALVRPWRGRVGIGYDGSRDAEAAAALARAITHNAAGQVAQLDVAYVDTSASAAAEADALTLDVRRTKMIEWWLTARVADFPTQLRVSRLTGDPAEELARLSEDLDLLVVGSRGRAPFRRVFTGSVSRELIAACHCPLLIVPAGATGRTRTRAA